MVEAQRIEAQRQQQEAQRIAQQEADRMRKIQPREAAGTISSYTIEDIRPGYKQPFFTSVKQSIKKVFKPSTYKTSETERAYRLATIGTKEGTAKKETAYEKIIDPFKFTGKVAGEELSIAPKFGTFDPTAPITKGEIEKERVRMELIKTGEADISKLSELYKETGTYKKAKEVPALIETTGVIGASFIPGAQVPLAGYFLGTGIKKGLDIQQAEKEGVKVPKSQKIEAGTRLGFGVSGFATGSRAIQSELLSSELKQLAKSPVKYKGTSVVDDKIGVIKIIGQQKRGGLTTDIEIGGKVIRESEKISFMPSGEGLAITRGQLSTNIEGEFVGKEGSKIFSKQAFKVGTKTIDLGKAGEYFRTLSKTTVIPESSIGMTYPSRLLPSLSQKKAGRKLTSFGKKLGSTLEIGGEDITSVSASVTKRIGKGKAGEEFFATSSGRLGIKEGELIQRSKDFGIIKQVRSDKQLPFTGLEKGDKGIKKIFGSLTEGKRTPMSKTFGVNTKQAKQVLVQTKTVKSISPDFAPVKQTISKGLQRIVPKQTTGLQSSFTGLGVYEKTTGVQLFDKPSVSTTIPRIDITPSATLRQKDTTLQKVTPAVATKTKFLIGQKTKPVTTTTLKQSSDVKTGTRTVFIPASRIEQKMKATQKLYSPINFDFATIKTTPTVTPILPVTVATPAFPFLQLPKYPVKKKQGYLPQAKTKGGKWITLSDKPLSRESALSRGSRAVDQTLSAQFRAKKVKGKITNGIDRYFGVTKNKYRPYKIKKGQKIELINHFIEKRGSRIDTAGEKRGLTLAKYAKQKGWIKNKRKSKKKGKK